MNQKIIFVLLILLALLIYPPPDLPEDYCVCVHEIQGRNCEGIFTIWTCFPDYPNNLPMYFFTACTSLHYLPFVEMGIPWVLIPPVVLQ